MTVAQPKIIDSSTAAYYGVFLANIKNGRIAIDSAFHPGADKYSAAPKPGDTPPICVEDFWRTASERNRSKLIYFEADTLRIAYRLFEGKPTGLFSFLRVWDQYAVKRYPKDSGQLTPIELDLEHKVMLISKSAPPTLHSSGKIIIAACEDDGGATFGIWNPIAYKKAGSP